MKILDFLKENKIGAIIGVLYPLIASLLYFLAIASNMDFIQLFLVPLFALLIFAWDIFNINFISLNQYYYDYSIFPFFIILSSFITLFIGAFIQKIINERKIKLIMFLGCILFVCIAFSTLWFLRPGPDVLPPRCSFGAELKCIDFQISATEGSFKLKLKNNIGEKINVESAILSTEATSNPYTCTAYPQNPTDWKSGNNIWLKWSGCSGGGIVAGYKGKVLVTINYYTESEPANIKEIKGEVFSTVI